METKHWNWLMKAVLILTTGSLHLQGVRGDVKAKMKYHLVDGTRPYFYGYVREGIKDGEVDAAGATVEKEVIFMNGRERELSLDANSFEMTKCETSLKNSDFYEEERKVTEIYYEEMAECVKQKLNAGHVKVFHHQIRNQAKNDNNNKPNNITTKVQGYALGPHSDTHPESADVAFAMIAMGENATFGQGRYLYLNLWRSIDDENTVMGHPLAMLDQTSLTGNVGSEDYVESDFFGEDPKSGFRFSLKQFRLNGKNSDAHRWFYFPNMTKSEVILFKQWDSDPQRQTNLCFHTAFEDPTTPPDAPSRQSIEVRMMVFFPDHVPNTCPGSLKKMLYLAAIFASVAAQKPLASAVVLGIVAVIAYLLFRCCRKRPSQVDKKKD